jgi:hypothetical protein
MEREEVYKLIDSERKYQKEVWPKGELRRGVLGGIQLLRKYLDHDFSIHYAQEEDAIGLDVPMECLSDIRKMAAILVRIMEYNNTPPRVLNQQKD